MSSSSPRRIALALLLAALLALPGASATPVRADDVSLVVHGEGALGLMLTDTYRDRFDLGGGFAARLGVELFGPLLELRVSGSGAWFPVERQDPGTLFTFGAGVRSTVRISNELSGLGGPFFDLDVGLAITGDLVRGGLDVGVGWSFFPVEELAVGPVIRYALVIQDPGDPVPDPASLLFFGLDVAIRFPIARSAPPPPIVIEREVEPAPAPDTDADGHDDETDRCVNEAEDVDGFLDEDGCPDLDDDSDGFSDEDDVCPRLPESRNGFDDEDGCPDDAPPPEPATGPVHGAPGRPLEHHVYFRVGSSNVSPRYHDEIVAVCSLMEREPDARIRVIGHADEQGTAAANHRLGAERAGAVAEQLVLCGVDPVRIESASYGDSRPACDDASEECRELRRRVEFELIEP